MRTFALSCILLISMAQLARAQSIPAAYANIHADENGLYILHPESGDKLEFISADSDLSPDVFVRAARGASIGLDFDFADASLQGLLYYGFVPTENVRFLQPVWFKYAEKITDGKASVNITAMKGKYDIVGWEISGRGLLAYRVSNSGGELIYEGRIGFKGKGPFEPTLTLTEGPFVNRITSESVTITFSTNQLCSPTVSIDGTVYTEKQRMMNPVGTTRHEILINKLMPATTYTYTVHAAEQSISHQFTTAPPPGSRKPFAFGYASDSRKAMGGGERNMKGVNAYMVKRIAALSVSQGAAFLQFTGDMINGQLSAIEETRLEYASWKRAVEPFWHSVPVYTGMGNHESVCLVFGDDANTVSVDRFPFASSSAETVFANEFCNPANGPLSEDGSYSDPDPNSLDFPPYHESVYSYTYDNVAMVVLNSDYWYAKNEEMIPLTGGNPHGYIMDNQLAWFAKTIERLEADKQIDHVFVSIHTPLFPNGGHAGDAMWYLGNNDIRPYVAGNPVEKGIIERRDELLDIMVNQSKKVVAVLAGDEHNYSRLLIDSDMDLYPENWTHQKLLLKRPLWQITNGSAGAPYYGRETLPWSDHLKIFSQQSALALFNINGPAVELKVTNPDTLEEIETIRLRQ